MKAMPRKKKTAGQMLAAKRKTHAGGRPAIPSACVKCGKPLPTAREAREHCKGKPRRPPRKVDMTIQQVFDRSEVLDSVKLASGDRMLKLQLAPHVILLTGIHANGEPWDSTMHTVDFALDDEMHNEAARRKLLKAMGMRGLKDFFLAYSVKRGMLMERFR